NAYGPDSEQAEWTRDGYRFEPGVAEAIFERLLRGEKKVRLLRRSQFDWDRKGAAQMAGRRLTSITVTDRDNGARTTIRARVFIDASYEGDVAVAAGVPYRIGREGRDEPLEPYAGVISASHATRQIFQHPDTGQPDRRIQAYNYRLCMTAREDLRLP